MNLRMNAIIAFSVLLVFSGNLAVEAMSCAELIREYRREQKSGRKDPLAVALANFTVIGGLYLTTILVRYAKSTSCRQRSQQFAESIIQKFPDFLASAKISKVKKRGSNLFVTTLQTESQTFEMELLGEDHFGWSFAPVGCYAESLRLFQLDASGNRLPEPIYSGRF